MAHVLATQGKEGSIEQRFRNFLLYIAQSGLKDQISFPENTLPLGTFSDPVDAAQHQQPPGRPRSPGGLRDQRRRSLGSIPTAENLHKKPESMRVTRGLACTPPRYPG